MPGVMADRSGSESPSLPRDRLKLLTKTKVAAEVVLRKSERNLGKELSGWIPLKKKKAAKARKRERENKKATAEGAGGVLTRSKVAAEQRRLQDRFDFKCKSSIPVTDAGGKKRSGARSFEFHKGFFFFLTPFLLLVPLSFVAISTSRRKKYLTVEPDTAAQRRHQRAWKRAETIDLCGQISQVGIQRLLECLERKDRGEE